MQALAACLETLPRTHGTRAVVLRRRRFCPHRSIVMRWRSVSA